MPDANGAWSPDEADAALNEFAKAFAQLTATQRRFGNGEERNPEAAILLHQYIKGLSAAQMKMLKAFVEAVPDICTALHVIIEIEQMRRVLDKQKVAP